MKPRPIPLTEAPANQPGGPKRRDCHWLAAKSYLACGCSKKKKPGTGGAPGFWIQPRGRFAGGYAALFYKPAATQLVPALSRAFFNGEAMNDLEAAHIVEPAPTSPPSPEEAIAAPITVYSRRETEEGYEGVIARGGDLRIVNCPDDIQWIVQRFTGTSAITA